MATTRKKKRSKTDKEKEPVERLRGGKHIRQLDELEMPIKNKKEAQE